MGTIVQEYGPIYGEAANGTVQGRPNGSIYVPSTNTITISDPNSSKLYWMSVEKQIWLYTTCICSVEAQDPASYIGISVFSDSACTTQIGSTRFYSAGNFAGNKRVVSTTGSTNPMTSLQTYYVRAELFNNGVVIATSNVLARQAA